MTDKVKKEKPMVKDEEFITDFDIYLFKEGNHFSVYEKLGAHVIDYKGKKGTFFAVWAPNATKISVIGNFNNWDKESHYMQPREDASGIWQLFIPGIQQGEMYKYNIISEPHQFDVEKTDPFGHYYEIAPDTASIVWELDYKWNDDNWMKTRKNKNSLESPMSVYEVHLGSWRTKPEENNRPLTYREAAHELAVYMNEMGFTHVEFLPVMEHPFSGSWGYQVLGFFAPTSRFGTPQDFMYMVDYLHQHDIGVILDWVPSHFPGDIHGLYKFDGTHLFEHQDPKLGFHPDWKSYIFNYNRNEIKEFLISSAVFWCDKYHIDGIRVDAVASMLYLDYSRKEGEWIPNEFGGRENLGAISFLRQMNEVVYSKFPGIQTIAEESTAWPMVTRPTYLGGLGFGLKWNMGWMHDTLFYFQKDPVYRKYDHNKLTFSIWYAFNENFELSLSHDEVVHGKGSLINKMTGDDWQKFANLRLLYGYMYTHPGKKLFFMGGEFGQWSEWNHEKSLDWHLLGYEPHENLQKWLKDLNQYYKQQPALFEDDFTGNGFEWIEANDSENSVLSYMRHSRNGDKSVIAVGNFTPVPRYNYRVGVPEPGYWKEVLNSDAKIYGGSGQGNMGGVKSAPVRSHGQYNSVTLTIPPLGIVLLEK
jgi:1,4-alpha-glucan branching enzyme